MRSALRIFLTLLLAFSLAYCAFAQQHAKRLILKDGSYQPILEYKVEGNRVHYRSAERFDWEDIPSELIDWDATNKFNANPVKSDDSRSQRDVAEEEARENAKSESDAPTVAPGLRLPSADLGGVFLLDNWKGRAELIEILQNGAETAKKGSADGMKTVPNPFATRHQSFTLQGQQAKVQSHVTSPVLYLCLQSGEKSADVASHYRLVQVQPDPKKNTRSVGTLNIALSGKTSQTERFLPSTATKLNEGPWVKLVPNEPLAPGEYAVVEMLGAGDMNLFVWDFGVNPSAPENLNPTLPIQNRRK